jgi:hypothetical protein
MKKLYSQGRTGGNPVWVIRNITLNIEVRK